MVKGTSTSPSSSSVMTSTGGLPLSGVDDPDVSITAFFSDMTASDSSTLILTPSVGDTAGGVALLTEGDGGDETIASRVRDGVRTFIVTRLDRSPEAGSGSICCRSGVVGMVGSESIFMAESLVDSGADLPAAGELGEESSVSTDRLREALAREVRRRFLADMSSSNGLGRVEQGSEETARSLDGSTVEA
jgi:hypothetical protein